MTERSQQTIEELEQKERAMLAVIEEAARGGDWRAATWLIEHVYNPQSRRRPGRPVGAVSAPDRVRVRAVPRE